jgi:hypothetical protein
LFRVKKFWQTEMTREDYMQFILDNLWIWREIPIARAEKILKDASDEGMRPCPICSPVFNFT